MGKFLARYLINCIKYTAVGKQKLLATLLIIILIFSHYEIMVEGIRQRHILLSQPPVTTVKSGSPISCSIQSEHDIILLCPGLAPRRTIFGTSKSFRRIMRRRRLSEGIRIRPEGDILKQFAPSKIWNIFKSFL